MASRKVNRSRFLLQVLRLWNALPEFVRFLVGKWFTLQFLGYALISFCLLSIPRWNVVYTSVYYVGHVIFLSWLLVGPVLRLIVSSKRDDAKIQ